MLDFCISSTMVGLILMLANRRNESEWASQISSQLVLRFYLVCMKIVKSELYKEVSSRASFSPSQQYLETPEVSN